VTARGRGKRTTSETAESLPDRRRAAPETETVAAIDLGTSNCRLLIARPTPEGFRVVDSFSRIVCLGEGLAEDGCLRTAAMDRAVAALRVCAAKLRRYRLRHLRAVATEACRRATNGIAFLDRVRQETGIELEVIDPEAEARLALAGCAPLLQPDIPSALIFDIGGGSTELIHLRAAQGRRGRLGLAAWQSVPFGVVGLSERYHDRPDGPETYAAMVAEVHGALRAFPAATDSAVDAAGGSALQMLGTSGTVTTLAGLYQRLPRYDRRRIDGCYLGFETVWTLSRQIASMNRDERLRHPCIGPHRAGLVLAGCAILEAICRTWPAGRLRVADRGLREGMLLEMLGRVRPEDFEDLTPQPPDTRAASTTIPNPVNVA